MTLSFCCRHSNESVSVSGRSKCNGSGRGSLRGIGSGRGRRPFFIGLVEIVAVFVTMVETVFCFTGSGRGSSRGIYSGRGSSCGILCLVCLATH